MHCYSPPINIAIQTTTTNISSTNNNSTTTSSKFIVLGIKTSHPTLHLHTRQAQFIISASGVFMFSFLYGYLQELISVTLCHQQQGLFLALMQFSSDANVDHDPITLNTSPDMMNLPSRI